MNETWQIAWLTIVTGILLAIGGGAAKMFFDLNTRVTRLEASLEYLMDSLGIKAAKMLHSPDNHLGIDHFLDSYIKGHADMPYGEWVDFQAVCQTVMDNPYASKNEKAQAEFLWRVCKHKLECKFVKKPTATPLSESPEIAPPHQE